MKAAAARARARDDYRLASRAQKYKVSYSSGNDECS